MKVFEQENPGKLRKCPYGFLFKSFQTTFGSWSEDKSRYYQKKIFPISGIDQRYPKKFFEVIHFFLVLSLLVTLTFCWNFCWQNRKNWKFTEILTKVKHVFGRFLLEYSFNNTHWWRNTQKKLVMGLMSLSKLDFNFCDWVISENIVTKMKFWISFAFSLQAPLVSNCELNLPAYSSHAIKNDFQFNTVQVVFFRSYDK